MLENAMGAPSSSSCTISTVRALKGVGTPTFLPHSHTAPLMASISHFLPFLMSYSMLAIRLACFFMATGMSANETAFFTAPR